MTSHNGRAPGPAFADLTTLYGDLADVRPGFGRTRITFLTYSLNYGGAERWLVDLATRLDRDRYAVTVAMLQPPTKPTALQLKASASVRIVTNAGGTPDIAVTWIVRPFPNAKHKVFCLHGADPESAALAAGVSGDAAVQYAAVSNRVGELLTPYGRPRIIYNGCDTARLTPATSREAVREQLKVDKTDILVGFLGRLADVKCPHAVAHAVTALRQRGFGSHGLFVGDYKGCHTERTQSIRLLLPDAIFLGPTEAIGDPLAAMDVLLLPSYSEGFSLAKIEAWLTRTPVVATPVGAIPELEQVHGQLVVRVPVGAGSDMLADAILQAVSPANDSVVTRAHALAWRDFTVEAMVARWDAYFQELLQ